MYQISGRSISFMELSGSDSESYVSRGLQELVGYYSNRLSYEELTGLVNRMSGSELLSSQCIWKIVQQTVQRLGDQQIEELKLENGNEIESLDICLLDQWDPYDKTSCEILLLDDGIQVKAQKDSREKPSLDGLEQIFNESSRRTKVNVLSDVILLQTKPDKYEYIFPPINQDGTFRLPIEAVVLQRIHHHYDTWTKPLPLVVISDGAKVIRQRLERLFGLGVCIILDWYHLGHKIRNLMSMIAQNKVDKATHIRELLFLLWHGHVEQALTYLKTQVVIRNQSVHQELLTYLEKHQVEIIDYDRRKKAGKSIGSGRMEKAVDQVIGHRQKRKVKFADYSQVTRSVTQSIGFVEVRRIQESSQQLLGALNLEGRSLRLLGLGIGKLMNEERDFHQLRLKYAPIYTSLVQNTISSLEDNPALSLLQSDTSELLTLECHAWLKLRRHSEVGREVDRWDFIVDSSNAPNWIPASLYILAADSLQYTDPQNPTKCCDSLYKLRQVYKDQPQWLASINNALCNAFIRQSEWRLALVSLDDMRLNAGGMVDWEISQQDDELALHRDELLSAFDAEILSRQGRILLQVGALPEARILFDRAKTLGEMVSPLKHYLAERLPGQLMLNKGLMQFAMRKIDDSMTAFKAAIDLLRQHDNEGVYNVRLFTGPVSTESTHSLLSSCWNNLGLAALYTCRMKEAVRMMESLVRENPTLYLTEQLAFNLCTLYELGADTAMSAKKKRILQLVAKRFFLHDIGPESFRVS